MSILVADTYGHKHMTPVNEAVSALRSHGYLVLPPGDTSPLGELVRAAIASHQCEVHGCVTCDDRLFAAVDDTAKDPTIRAWVDRGRG